MKNVRHVGMSVAFMSGAPDAAASTAAATGKKTAKTTTAAVKSNIVVVGFSSSVTMPTPKSNRGTKERYGHTTLEVGQSIVVKGCTAKSLNGTISVWNRKARVQRIGADGKPAFEQVEMKNADGTVAGTTNDTTKPIMDETKHFFASDCDSKSDPDGADVRIWRDK